MPRSIICCVCSRSKNNSVAAIPAKERYAGSHVATVGAMAQAMGMPFYILSGVHGLVAANELVGLYDHLLTADEVTRLATQIGAQLRELGVKEVNFYTKRKRAWFPYLNALIAATSLERVFVFLHFLHDDE